MDALADIYIPLHVRSCGEEDALPMRRGELPLIDGISDFCASFFHMEAVPEVGMEETCVAKTCCARKSVVCIARLVHRGEDVFVSRYSNSPFVKRRGSRRVHAEQFVVYDKALRDKVASSPGACLVLYLTYQPCHFSGGHTFSQIDRADTSCSLLLERFHSSFLAPRNVSLDLKVAFVYRSHWKTSLVHPRYAPAIERSKEGIRLLKRAGVGMAAFRAQDWEYVLSHCTSDVRDAFREKRPPFTDDVRFERAALDVFFHGFLSSV